MELPEPPLRLEYIREPLLGFAFGQQCEHPKDGLYLYGPVSGRTRNIVTVGVIGTKDGVGYFKSHLQSITRYIEVEPAKKTDKKDRPHLSDFPGLDETFGLHVDPEALVMRVIDAKSLDEATRQLNHHEAVAQAAELYINEAERYGKNEERNIDIWIMVVPELVFDRCKPESQRLGVALLKGQFGRRQKARVDLPLLADVIDQDAEIIFEDIPDFHRHIKARLLKLGKTSQIFRETTLAPKEFVNRAGYLRHKLAQDQSRRGQAPGAPAREGRACRTARRFGNSQSGRSCPPAGGVAARGLFCFLVFGFALSTLIADASSVFFR